MGGALVAGILAAKIVKPGQISVSDIDGKRRASLKRSLGVRVAKENSVAVRNADVVVLCVKPQQINGVLDDLKTGLDPRTLVISVAAGVRTERIERVLGKIPVIRVMPNTPALLRAGAMAFSLGRHARIKHERMAKTLLSALGTVWKVPEVQLDAVTALSGSGPAYVFYLTECLTAAGVSLGLPLILAEGLARQTVYGAGRMLNETSTPAAELRRRVTSPGGTTEAALQVLLKKNLTGIVREALTVARRRSQELSAGQ
jgi:pyrroline-5-carboxylate reductase